MFMTVFSRTSAQRVVIWGLAFLFMLPRLVAGAHWGQDDYIGGVAMAALALGWGYYTPLCGACFQFPGTGDCATVQAAGVSANGRST